MFRPVGPIDGASCRTMMRPGIGCVQRTGCGPRTGRGQSVGKRHPHGHGQTPRALRMLRHCVSRKLTGLGIPSPALPSIIIPSLMTARAPCLHARWCSWRLLVILASGTKKGACHNMASRLIDHGSIRPIMRGSCSARRRLSAR